MKAAPELHGELVGALLALLQDVHAVAVSCAVTCKSIPFETKQVIPRAVASTELEIYDLLGNHFLFTREPLEAASKRFRDYMEQTPVVHFASAVCGLFDLAARCAGTGRPERVRRGWRRIICGRGAPLRVRAACDHPLCHRGQLGTADGARRALAVGRPPPSPGALLWVAAWGLGGGATAGWQLDGSACLRAGRGCGGAGAHFCTIRSL